MTMSIPEIERTLGQLRLSGARDTLQTRLQQALVSQMPPAELLAVLLEVELDHRHSRQIDKRYKTSRLDEKSAKAVAYQAVQQGLKVAYMEADADFARYALADGRSRELQLQRLLAADLVVLDGLFLARRIAEAAAEFLQALVHQRYRKRGSLLVTSNRVIEDWGAYLGDATMASTILDRLMHRCRLLQFAGKSYRLKEAAQRLAIKDSAD
jgi:DNA replication protein DnaC